MNTLLLPYSGGKFGFLFSSYGHWTAGSLFFHTFDTMLSSKEMSVPFSCLERQESSTDDLFKYWYSQNTRSLEIHRWHFFFAAVICVKYCWYGV